MRRRYHLHLAGVLYIGLAVLVGIAAANRPNNLLVWVFGVMLSAVLVSGIVSGVMMLGVRVIRLDPRHGRVGEPLVVRYAITNRSWLMPIFNLHVAEQPGAAADAAARERTRSWWSFGRGAPAPDAATDWTELLDTADAWVMHTGPGETVHGEAVMWPRRRGPVHLDRLTVWSTFPFGLIRKSVDMRQPQETLVYPQVHTLRPDFLRAITPGGLGGLRSSRRLGHGEDYFGTREYRPGDSVRQIAWKRGAGLDELVSIERTQPSPPRLRVILNLLRPTADLRTDPHEGLAPRELEERAISLAASLLAAAESEGYEVGLTVLGLDVPPSPLRRGYRHLQRLMAALAGLDLNRPRLPRSEDPVADAERAGLIVVSADRADPGIVGPAGGGSLHLTARQLDDLVVEDTPHAEAVPA